MKKDKEYEITRNNKTKSHNPLANVSQTQIQVLKKDKDHRSHQGHSATGLNAIKVSKKNKTNNKDKKNLSHIQCHACKQKSQYANKCPKQLKN